MPLHSVSQLLVDALESMPALDGRFVGIKCVNFDPASGVRRGCLSLVFRALDQDTGNAVALKFFDPERGTNVYRVNAFHREHQLLEHLINVPRCLQLASGLNEFNLMVPHAAGGHVPLPCKYFAVQWVEGQIDQYFLCQESFAPVEKLVMFSEIVRSVEALHSQGIFHRDLKPDNLRVDRPNGKRSVVAIDLGTAARNSSAPIDDGYERQVGAQAYAAPEARCGLASNRRIAKGTDLYALGCMLFELFNRDLHLRALWSANPNFEVLLAVLRSGLDPRGTEVQQQREWNAALDRLAASFSPAPIDGEGSDVPPGISGLLSEVAAALTNVDYRQRPTTEWVRQRVSSAIKVLSNERAYQARLARARAIRQQRIDKLRRREARLAEYLKRAEPARRSIQC